MTIFPSSAGSRGRRPSSHPRCSSSSSSLPQEFRHQLNILNLFFFNNLVLTTHNPHSVYQGTPQPQNRRKTPLQTFQSRRGYKERYRQKTEASPSPLETPLGFSAAVWEGRKETYDREARGLCQKREKGREMDLLNGSGTIRIIRKKVNIYEKRTKKKRYTNEESAHLMSGERKTEREKGSGCGCGVDLVLREPLQEKFLQPITFYPKFTTFRGVLVLFWFLCACSGLGDGKLLNFSFFFSFLLFFFVCSLAFNRRKTSNAHGIRGERGGKRERGL